MFDKLENKIIRLDKSAYEAEAEKNELRLINSQGKIPGSHIF